MVSFSDRNSGIVALNAAMLLWGLNFVTTKIALDEFDAFALLLFRLGLSTLLFVVIVRTRGVAIFKDTLLHWRAVLPLAVLGILLNQLFFMWGIDNTTPSHSALMYTLLPIFTALFAKVFIAEKITLSRWLGIGLACTGAIWLTTEGGLELNGVHLLGDVITLGGVISFSLFLVLAKPVLADLGVMRTLGIAYILAFPLVLPFTILPAFEQDWLSPSAAAWGGALFLVFGGTVGAYLLHQYALKRLSSALVAAFAYTQPVFATLFSVLILNERLSPPFFIAALLIFSGLSIAQRRRPQVETNSH